LARIPRSKAKCSGFYMTMPEPSFVDACRQQLAREEANAIPTVPRNEILSCRKMMLSRIVTTG